MVVLMTIMMTSDYNDQFMMMTMTMIIINFTITNDH